MTVHILTNAKKTAYNNRRLVEEFAILGIETTLVNPEKFDIVVGDPSQSALHYNKDPYSLPKLLLTRTGSGTNAFASSVIKQLQEERVSCINNAESINLVKDKMTTHQILDKHNIPIPKTMLVRFPVNIAMVEQKIGYPCVVKIITGSSGIGVYKCDKKSDFIKLMEFVKSLESDKTLIVQEFIGTQPGEDLRVLVVGGNVLGAMKRIAPTGDFRANISNGGSGEPYPLNDEICFLARETARLCGLEIAGIDLLFSDNSYKLCEANSNPGFAGFEEYCGINVASNIAEFVKFKIQNL